MCISVFYAQAIGLWLFLVSLAMLVHHQRFKKISHEFITNYALITFSGMVSLALGLVIVISHNLWVTTWPVVVTIIGWLFLVQGILRIFFPEHFSKIMKDLMAKSGYKVMSWVWLLVGAYLVYAGFVG